MRLIAGLYLFLCLNSAFSLEVVADFGAKEINSVLGLPQGLKPQMPETAVAPQLMAWRGHYQKSKLTPGYVAPKRVSKDFPYAVFVVSDDPYSVKWLEGNIAEIKASKALGIGVNIKHLDSFEKISTFIEKPLLALDISSLTETFGIEHYPFVILDGRVFQ